jgi:hypothetical protein
VARVFLSVTALLVACEAPPSAPGHAASQAEPAHSVGPVRQAPERYFMTRTGERCEVTVEIDGEVIARREPLFACPRDLEIGERIRLAGRTCIRESPAAERAIPVVCPDHLTNTERDRRRDAGR